MQRRRWIEDLNTWEGFSYLRLKGVPMKRSKNGGLIDFDTSKLEKLVAQGILQNQVPLRGKELRLLRSATRLSMNKFAQKLGITNTAIYHWEKAEKQRLMIINEIAVKLLCAEELGVELINQGFSRLRGDERHEPISIQVTGKRPTKKQYKVKTLLKPSYRGDRKVKVRVKQP